MARWYIIHAYSGFENKVRDSVLAEAERMGLSGLVEAVEVPVETVAEIYFRDITGRSSRDVLLLDTIDLINFYLYLYNLSYLQQSHLMLILYQFL